MWSLIGTIHMYKIHFIVLLFSLKSVKTYLRLNHLILFDSQKKHNRSIRALPILIHLLRTNINQICVADQKSVSAAFLTKKRSVSSLKKELVIDIIYDPFYFLRQSL